MLREDEMLLQFNRLCVCRPPLALPIYAGEFKSRVLHQRFGDLGKRYPSWLVCPAVKQEAGLSTV